MSLGPALAERIVPLQAGWFAGEDPLRRALRRRRCGSPPTPAASTPRPPGSPGSAPRPALELINEIGVEAIHAHDLALANRFRAGLGLRARRLGDRHDANVPGAGERAAAARASMAAARAGRLRASFHVYNTEEDVDAALEALAAERSAALRQPAEQPHGRDQAGRAPRGEHGCVAWGERQPDAYPNARCAASISGCAGSQRVSVASQAGTRQRRSRPRAA